MFASKNSSRTAIDHCPEEFDGLHAKHVQQPVTRICTRNLEHWSTLQWMPEEDTQTVTITTVGRSRVHQNVALSSNLLKRLRFKKTNSRRPTESNPSRTKNASTPTSWCHMYIPSSQIPSKICLHNHERVRGERSPECFGSSLEKKRSLNQKFQLPPYAPRIGSPSNLFSFVFLSASFSCGCAKVLRLKSSKNLKIMKMMKRMQKLSFILRDCLVEMWQKLFPKTDMKQVTAQIANPSVVSRFCLAALTRLF